MDPSDVLDQAAEQLQPAATNKLEHEIDGFMGAADEVREPVDQVGVDDVTTTLTVDVLALGGEEALPKVHLLSTSTVYDLKGVIEEQLAVQMATQILLFSDRELHGSDVLGLLAQEGHVTVTLIHDERPLYTWWNIEENPDADKLSGEGGRVNLVNDTTGYVHVHTLAPITSGTHYFEFHMLKIGDEQWCGVTNTNQAGHHVHPSELKGTFYYCGRRRGRTGGMRCDSMTRVDTFKRVDDGGTIGMLLDMEKGVAAFLHDGKLQFACPVPKGSLFLSTTVNCQDDAVELRRKCIAEAPQEAIDALDNPYCIDGPPRKCPRAQ